MNDLTALARGIVATGFDGESPPDDLPEFGGYILFARNCASIARVRALTDALRVRAPAGVAPLVAIDQEGGRVMRLRSGVEPMPSMMALGACGDLELAGRAGEQLAFDLRRAGCTFDLAPVLDLALDPRNTVIGTRSFGCDPSQVARIGQAFARGLERGGMLACYKHFPGHGATPVDSHVDLPAIDASAQTLRERDLVPFAAVARDARAIMGAHVLVQAFDRTRPATLSPAVVNDLLRGELGFGGAFVTDCLEMAAVAERDGSAGSAVAAVAAGADLLLVSHRVELALAAADAIAAAVTDGRISIERLREAHARVSALRAAAAAPLPLDGFPPHPGVGREAARRAITLVRGLAHADPVASIAVSFGGDQAPARSLRSEAPALDELHRPPDAGEDVVEAIARSGRRPIVLAHRAHLHPEQARAIARILESYPDAVVVSTLEPWDLALFPNARHLLAAYGDDEASVGGLADVLFGASLPEGTLPVEIAVGV